MRPSTGKPISKPSADFGPNVYRLQSYVMICCQTLAGQIVMTLSPLPTVCTAERSKTAITSYNAFMNLVRNGAIISSNIFARLTTPTNLITILPTYCFWEPRVQCTRGSTELVLTRQDFLVGIINSSASNQPLDGVICLMGTYPYNGASNRIITFALGRSTLSPIRE